MNDHPEYIYDASEEDADEKKLRDDDTLGCCIVVRSMNAGMNY